LDEDSRFARPGNRVKIGLAGRNDLDLTFIPGGQIAVSWRKFGDLNPGFEADPEYLAEREGHKELAGRFIAVHRLRATARPLIQILGEEQFERLQDVWAQSGNRNRWSVAFPIVESYRINGCPKAKGILGETSYNRLYAHSSATLGPLNDGERAAIADLEIEQVTTLNAWIGIEDEFARAERSEIGCELVREVRDAYGIAQFFARSSYRA
jgi:5-methylcytosine-specific restriction protein A